MCMPAEGPGGQAPSLIVPQVALTEKQLMEADQGAVEEEPPDWGGDEEELPEGVDEVNEQDLVEGHLQNT